MCSSDLIEKAHPDMFNILLQVMDYATLTDNNGRKADFSHVILLMTTNAGAREMSAKSIGFSGKADPGEAAGKGQKVLERLFSPEFRNRLDGIIHFKPLTPEIMSMIVGKFIGELNAQMRERNVTVKVSDEAAAVLAEKGFDPSYGARPLARVIQTEIKDALAQEMLFGALQKGGTAYVSPCAKCKGKPAKDGGEQPLFTFRYEGPGAASKKKAPEMAPA